MNRKRGKRGAGTVTQRKDGLWMGQFSYVDNGKRERATVYGDTMTEVQAKLSKKRVEVLSGEHMKADGMTVGAYVLEWIDDVRGPSLRESTKLLYRGVLENHIVPYIGQVRLNRLSSDQIATFYKDLRKDGRSERMLRNVHVLLGAALRQAVKTGRLNRSPLLPVDAPIYRPPEMNYLDDEQGERFLQAAASEPMFAFFMLALDSGMRLGELCGLRRSDVDLKAGRIAVRRSVSYATGKAIENLPKTNETRVVPISKRTAAALRTHMKTNLTSTYLFSDERGNPLRKDSKLFRTIYPAVLKRAKVPAIRFHDLRHSAATRMLAHMQPKVVASILGHNVETLLKTYGHALPAAHREGVNHFDSLATGGKT